ncbi:hypothetical protein BJV77DRAFT_961478 [Russula vinacea]|nr:hypothetical protein BJV77DRAFT_961478 [Russula vinacea]
MFGTDDNVDFRQTSGIHGMYTVCRKGCWGVLFGFNNRECGTLDFLTIFRTWHSSRVPLEPTYSKIRNANLVNSILFRNGNRTGGSHLPTGSLACPAINDGRTYPELRLITQNKTPFAVLSLMCQCRSSYLGTACLFLRRLDVCSVAFSVDIKINDEVEYGQLTLSLLLVVLRSHSLGKINFVRWDGQNLISGTFGKATQISTKLNN